MINTISWLMSGIICSWLAELVIGDDKSKLLNCIIGIIGALSGGSTFNLVAKGGPKATLNDFSVTSLLVSLICACVLLSIMNLFRHGSIYR